MTNITKNTHIALIGDSIFDNESYVDSGHAVSDILRLKTDSRVSLLAIDGDITTGVAKQLKRLDAKTTDVFVSVGGNDALQSIPVLSTGCGTVAEACEILHLVRENFRTNYAAMLKAVKKKHYKITVCTIYNKVPNLPDNHKTALALFNEVITEEAQRENLPVIDLRTMFNEDQDYSPVSPIEPSYFGGLKLADAILDAI